jgi:hypothetical protein
LGCGVHHVTLPDHQSLTLPEAMRRRRRQGYCMRGRICALGFISGGRWFDISNILGGYRWLVADDARARRNENARLRFWVDQSSSQWKPRFQDLETILPWSFIRFFSPIER